MQKHFILDTNVFLHNPRAPFLFQDNHIVVPITVIEEIDRFKRDFSEIGRNARLTSRYLDDMREQGDLMAGVPLEGGGTLRVDIHSHHDKAIDDILLDKNADQRILQTALFVQRELRKQKIEQPVILVTKDTNLRIKATALGLQAEDFENAKVNIEELYSGRRDLAVTTSVIEEIYDKKELPLADVLAAASPAAPDDADRSAEESFYPNQFLHLFDLADEKSGALTRLDPQAAHVLLLPKFKQPVMNIQARNREQRFALNLLLDDRIRLVTLVGMAGTGKTLLALAAGLYKVLNENFFLRLLVSRPVFPLGRELGFLPGDLDDKLRPWMQPIFDNLELLLASPTDKAQQYTRLNDYIEQGLVELEALTYIRGRSISNCFLLIDEAQNLTPHEIKTAVTRAGEGTKVILTGDPYQIDNPYLDSNSNGLTYVVERMKAQALAGHVTLMKGERSPLAELAATCL